VASSLRSWLACAALALIACERAEPAEPSASVVAAAPEAEVADSLVEELPPEAQDRVAPELPAAPPAPEQARAESPPAESPPAEATRPSAAPTAAAAAVAAAKATAEKPERPPLDILLKQPQSIEPGESSSIDLTPGAPSPAAPGAADPGVLDRWKQHVRLERHSEPVGPAGPRQGTHSETEAALRVPVDESVSLEGGVRVDSREDPGVKEPVRKSTPRVGVEVRF
jgi:hypothetical protein